MPYLDSKISDKHKAGCKKPKAKRLYIRDYGDKGQQIFIPYGITCPSCEIIVKDKKQEKPKSKASEIKTKPKRFCGYGGTWSEIDKGVKSCNKKPTFEVNLKSRSGDTWIPVCKKHFTWVRTNNEEFRSIA